MKSNKGFTLTELLVTMAILAVITGISIPLIINIQQSQTKRKYKVYGETLISSAKLYNDSYGEDLFGKRESDCRVVTYADLEDKKLVKDIDMSGISCKSDKTMVRIQKAGKTYGYTYKIGCGAEKNGKANDIQVELPTKSDLECTGNENIFMDVTANPPRASEGYNSVSRKTRIIIESSTGVAEGSKIKYAWVKNWDINSTNYTSVSDWKNVVFSKFDSTQKQKETIKSGTNVAIQSKFIQTPTGGSGDYYLIISMDDLCNLSGEGCVKADNKYKVFGPYKIDNQKPSILKFEVKSKKTGYNDKTAVIDYNATDDQVESSKLSICISKKPCEDSDYKSYGSVHELKLSDSQDGKEYTVYLGVKDKAGNKIEESKKYTVYKECTDKVNDGNWVDASTCTKKCGGGTINQKSGNKDKYTGAKCSGENTRTTSCNEMDCCSKLKEDPVCDGWGDWTPCSAVCGNGTKSHSRTCHKVSAYDGRVCSDYPDTANTSCNVRSCCSSTKEVIASYGNWYGCTAVCGSGTEYRTVTYYTVSNYNGQRCTNNATRTQSSTCYNYSGCCNSTRLANGRWERYTSCQRVHHTGRYVIFEYTYKYRERYVYDRVSNYNGQYCSKYNTSQTRAQDSIFCW